jgi:hypothetical protein
MKKFKITIDETLKKTVIIKAETADSAWDIAQEVYLDGGIVLEYDNLADSSVGIPEEVGEHFGYCYEEFSAEDLEQKREE